MEKGMNTLMTIVSEYGLFLGIPLLFLAVVVWIYRPGARKRYKDDGKIPFASDKAEPTEDSARPDKP
jgi:cbb3-type cytochrome oxidase subunit 3